MFVQAVQHEIYGYNNVDYRAFWQEAGREYEDAALTPGGSFIFEYANKRNLMEICRWHDCTPRPASS